ncbi:MAG: GIY-YIG nuclease family protein [Gammaproteobacteria bacterium]|nr:GIY-YIG nuclease family protein [Gammaproteobacteria bacterium]
MQILQSSDGTIDYRRNSAASFNPTIRCGKNCLCCPMIYECGLVKSTILRRQYHPIVKKGVSLTCETRSVIYLITCKKCEIQYVGQTKRALKDRILEHRRSVLKKGAGTFLSKHFSNDQHSHSDIMVQIVQTVDATDSLHERELYWIQLLNTAYPFGLNDNISGYGNISEDVDPLHKKNHPYFCIKAKLRKRKNKNKRNSKVKNQNILQNLKDLYSESGVNLRRLFMFLKQQSRKTLKICHNNIMDRSFDKMPVLKLTVVAFMAGFYDVRTVNKTSKPPQERLIIPFLSKGIQDLNLMRCLGHSIVRKASPFKHLNFKIQIVYAYDDPISRKIFNYTNILRKINSITELKDQMAYTCGCQDSKFLYQPHGHVITGNLDFIENKKLRNIMSKGTKFRIPKKNNWCLINHTIRTAFWNMCKRLSTKYRLNLNSFLEYGRQFELQLQHSIDKVKKGDHFNTDLQMDRDVTEALAYLQQRYVICPADKASGNYIMICKKFYLRTICKELGISIEEGRFVGNGVYSAVKQGTS